MEYLKKNIFKFCIFGLIAFILIIPSVFAEEVDIGYVTNNTEVLMDIPSSGSGAPINLPVNTANSYGNIYQLWINVSNLSITPDYIYQLELRTPNASLTNITTLQILANNGQICNPLGFTDLTNGYPKIYFSCKSSASYISIYLYNNTGSTSPITTAQNFRWNYAYLRYFTEDTDIDLGPVISNQQQNTQQIIDNQNQLLGDKCSNLFDKNTMLLSSSAYLPYDITSTQIKSWTGSGPQTLIIKLESGKTYTITKKAGGRFRAGFVNSANPPLDTNNVVTRIATNDNTTSFTFTMPNNMNYFIANFYSPDQQTDTNIGLQAMLNSIMINEGSTGKPYCAYGSYTSKLDDVSGAIGGVTDAITDDNIGSSSSDASDFITNFSTNTFGLTSIVTAPLTLIQSLTSSTCTDLELPLPYLNNKKLTLPCMTTIYSTYFGTFFTMYQTITYGIIAYWVIVRIFNQVKDFKNPEHDEIEVVDL